MNTNQPIPFSSVQASNKLTPKRQGFVKARVDMPKATLAEQVIEAGYKVSSKAVASQIGGELLKKPEIIMALGKHNDTFESVIANTAKDWGNSDKPREREIALEAAKFGHDKIHGKSKQAVDVTTTGITLTIDLTSALSEQQ